MKTFLILVGAGALLFAATVVVWVYIVQNVETPDYEVVAADGPFEIRDYPALTVAEVERAGLRKPTLGQGFQSLAGYIFAREREGPKIAMTAPVLQQPAEEGSWRIAFVMPAGSDPETLPVPDNASVRLETRPPTRFASVRFPGHPGDAELDAKEAELRGWLATRGVAPTGPAIHAYYNDPFTPGFLRRNEVLLALGSG